MDTTIFPMFDLGPACGKQHCRRRGEDVTGKTQRAHVECCWSRRARQPLEDPIRAHFGYILSNVDQIRPTSCRNRLRLQNNGQIRARSGLHQDRLIWQTLDQHS